MTQAAWPELPYAAWKKTYATQHLWTQIVGKIRQLIEEQVGCKRAHGAREGRAVEDVAYDRLCAHPRQPSRLLRRSRHRADGVTGVHEQWHETATDGTGSTREKDSAA